MRYLWMGLMSICSTPVVLTVTTTVMAALVGTMSRPGKVLKQKNMLVRTYSHKAEREVILGQGKWDQGKVFLQSIKECGSDFSLKLTDQHHKNYLPFVKEEAETFQNSELVNKQFINIIFLTFL